MPEVNDFSFTRFHYGGSITGFFALFAVAAMVLVVGCKKEATPTPGGLSQVGQDGTQTQPATSATTGTAGGGPGARMTTGSAAPGGAARSRGPGGPGRSMGPGRMAAGGPPGTGPGATGPSGVTTTTPGAAGARAQPMLKKQPTPVSSLSEVDKAKKVQDFNAVYGPIKLLEQKNWDGRLIYWVLFSHKQQRIKLPLSIVLATPEPKNAEGYFQIYPAKGGTGKTVSVESMIAATKAEQATATQSTTPGATPGAVPGAATGTAGPAATRTGRAPTTTRGATVTTPSTVPSRVGATTTMQRAMPARGGTTTTIQRRSPAQQRGSRR